MISIVDNRYAGSMPVFHLDFVTAAELSQIRDSFTWASQRSRISLRGSVALCLASADDKYSPQYLSRLIEKVRQTPRLEDLDTEVLNAIAEVIESTGFGHTLDLLDSVIESRQKKK